MVTYHHAKIPKYHSPTFTLHAFLQQPSVLSMRADVDILLHSLSSRHSVQPNALKVSATLFSHLKVSKALSASSRMALYRIHTRCCIFSPSKFAPFVPAILEQSFRPPTSLLHCIYRQRWTMTDLTGNYERPSFLMRAASVWGGREEALETIWCVKRCLTELIMGLKISLKLWFYLFFFWT